MYPIQIREVLEHQTLFWRPHLWKTLTHPASPERSSVDGGGKVLDISSLNKSINFTNGFESV